MITLDLQQLFLKTLCELSTVYVPPRGSIPNMSLLLLLLARLINRQDMVFDSTLLIGIVVRLGSATPSQSQTVDFLIWVSACVTLICFT